MQLTIGRIGKAHGIRGEVSVTVRTDDPEDRFAVGAVIDTDPPERGPLTVASVRAASGRLVVGFEQVADRNAAEELRGTMLVIDSDDLPPLDSDDDFYDHELVGMRVLRRDADQPIGEVADVVHGPAGDTLAVRLADGDGEVLVPFVREIVPVVDRDKRQIVIDPPEGLLEL